MTPSQRQAFRTYQLSVADFEITNPMTPSQRQAFRTYTCPACKKPLHQNHVYPVALDTCLTRCTLVVPMHLLCARAITQVNEHSLLWIVRSSSWNAPTARTICLDGVGRFYLHRPLRLEFWEGTRPATYAEIRARLEPVFTEAEAKAQNDHHELADITRQIAWLHKFLPKRQ